MRIKINQDPAQSITQYRTQMYSPLCGIVTSIGYSLRSRSGPRVFVAGGELTGVHALLGQDAPKPGSYHIGGSGLQPFEPDIRVFAEATERYSSAVAVLGSRHPMRWTTHDRLREEGEPVLDAALLSSYDGPGRLSPYDGFRSDAPMTWVRLPRVFGPEGDTWVPAQLFFVGYTPKRHDGEPWLQAAVTTGTAVHTSYDRALAAAIYEIIQVDATMPWAIGTAPRQLSGSGPMSAPRALTPSSNRMERSASTPSTSTSSPARTSQTSASHASFENDRAMFLSCQSDLERMRRWNGRCTRPSSKAPVSGCWPSGEP